MELRGFARISLAPGETKSMTFTLDPAQAAIWKQGSEWIVESGRLDFMVGASASDIRDTVSVNISSSETTFAPAAALKTKVDIQ
jgi:beta-glucosidase